MPYQCFQEARKVLAADREEKLVQIAEQRRRIAKWQAAPAQTQREEGSKKGRLVAMQKHLEDLKILADINDPVIRKRFEDGMGRLPPSFDLDPFYLQRLTFVRSGDMDRPIYRYLADRKWRSYDRKLLMQRIEQHHLVPDILPHLNPTASVSIGFGRRNVQPGQFVGSVISKLPLHLNIQVFDKGLRLVTIAVVDPDVPDVANDSFTSRCHYLAVNIPLSPTNRSVPLRSLNEEKHIVQSWLPPFAQKGAPYHRLAVIVLQQNGESAMDVKDLRKWQTKREGWRLKQLLTHHKELLPVGAGLFRTRWDEGTDGVMERAGLAGVNMEFLRKKGEKNVYKKKDGARYR
ncbi:uncharacterized protein KY384_004911 [Bacidia gigantensis]|uniref:uncharacterized protein n=1 Tax=Bacidia gigantensis TaxID=2732470 RepID=UPI001D04EA91|nr:uncharacterized protein KY384_004911 [Bacidia gigantensis]KAG8530409.1 hypothetical protein KY384_004911 [Bacidia gigantensis]